MRPEREGPRSRRPLMLLLVWLAAPMALALPLLLATPSGASQEADPETETDGATDADVLDDEMLALGAEVYTAVCSACHQPNGAGLSGQYPPLINNPHVDDGDYVIDVIRNGRQGVIEVNGETYDGVMPAFSTVTDEEANAIVFYIQSGFQAPSGPVASVGDGAVAGTELPGLTNFTMVAAFLIVGAGFALVLGPRIIGANDRLAMNWLDAWMKTAVILVGMVAFTMYVPNWAIQTDTVAGLDRLAQDIIGTSLWLGGLGAAIWALWYAHREDRI